MRRKTAYVILLMVAVSCFRDLGNYDYVPVNEAVIGEKGFERTLDVRRDMDVLKIEPEISFTLDGTGEGGYEYEWVAVGQHFYRGERFVIGTQRNLEYEVKLPAEEYVLYLKVRDPDTDMVFSRSVPLNVRSTNTLGWILGGEDPQTGGQVDMISLSSETIYLKNALKKPDGFTLAPVELVWIDNDEWTSEDRLYAGTLAGSYKFDRTGFEGSPYTSLQYSFAFPEQGASFVMTDSQKVSDKRHVVIVDGRAYEVSSDGGMIGNTFCVYDGTDDFSVADKMICNHTHVQGIRTFVFYDRDNRKFCYISGLVVKGMNVVGDAEGDSWSWDTTRDFTAGLDMVTAVNSFFGGGLSLAVMNEPGTSDKWIYEITAPNTSVPVKGGRYKVDKGIASGFDDAAGYMLTTHHGFLIYASGSRLYGYNYRKEPQECVVLHEFDAPVTCLKADYDTAEKYSDVFYVATYDDSRERSGIVYKFQVDDNPDSMGIARMDMYDEGFLKVKTMCYKAF